MPYTSMGAGKGDLGGQAEAMPMAFWRELSQERYPDRNTGELGIDRVSKG
jgi:hypothetical protein